MKDLMIDMETRGQGPGCIILSLGAVFFDPTSGAIGDSFSQVINKASSVALGLIEDDETVAWWRKQSPEAQRVLAEVETSPHTVRDALTAFADFIHDRVGANAVRVWGNGADFDNAILAHTYGLLGMKAPWRFWNNRCFRTLKTIGKGVEQPPRLGVHHDALDDARHQAIWACSIFANLPLTA